MLKCRLGGLVQITKIHENTGIYRSKETKDML